MALFRTRSSHPWALINCSRQLVVLKKAKRFRFRTLGCLIRMLSGRISGRYRILAGRHPAFPGQADNWLSPLFRMILVIGVSGRDRLAVFRTTGCREQPISDQGGLERVLQTASQSLPLARRLSRTRLAHGVHRQTPTPLLAMVLESVTRIPAQQCGFFCGKRNGPGLA